MNLPRRIEIFQDPNRSLAQLLAEKYVKICVVTSSTTFSDKVMCMNSYNRRVTIKYSYSTVPLAYMLI